jgi:hypothetical protein
LSRLFECPQCGRKVASLQEVTAEDIQREKAPPAGFRFVCEECLARIRSISRLESQYSLGKGIRDALVIVPIFSLFLILAQALLSLVLNISTSDMSRLSIFIGGATTLSGIGMVWERLRNRYGWNHDLRWALNSRPVLIAFAVVATGIISLIVSNYFYNIGP